jgi:hypothetical protein
VVLKAAGSAAPLVVRAHSWRPAGQSVGHAGCCFLLVEMFGEEEPAAMMVSGFQQEGRLVRCLYAAGTVPEAGLFYRSEIERKAQRTRPDGRLNSVVGGAEAGKKEGVHNVQTLGFGSGRTGAGLGRIAEIFGGVAEIQGQEPGSSPTSGTVFPQVRGLLVFFSSAHCAHSRL